ncbi:hypothetical protein FACS1894219_12280 [Clostridia bacterium]|nr:hypothetical protein FACS1894219_12280 [Clostridia bacterium]
MLFNEMYGTYFRVVADVLKRAVTGKFTKKELKEIVGEKAFVESSINICDSLTTGEWQLLLPDMSTPIRNVPTLPLTLLQKRWMKAILNDPRIKLFSLSDEGLEDIKPLYTQDTFTYYDRFGDGDPSKTYCCYPFPQILPLPHLLYNNS